MLAAVEQKSGGPVVISREFVSCLPFLGFPYPDDSIVDRLRRAW